MNALAWLFVYTPFPWFGTLYTVAYRYELSRIARPFVDGSSPATWWSVCTHLGLIPADAPRPVTRLRIASYFLAITAAGLVSVLWIMKFIPLVWYYVTILQVASALILFFVLVHHIGPLPRRPYRDVLPYPRLGTRIRHLKKADGEKYSLLTTSELQEQHDGKDITT